MKWHARTRGCRCNRSIRGTTPPGGTAQKAEPTSRWGRVAQWAKERGGAWADLLVVDGNPLENMVASLGAGSSESARGIYSPSAAVGRNGFVRGQRVPRIVRQPRARETPLRLPQVNDVFRTPHARASSLIRNPNSRAIYVSRTKPRDSMFTYMYVSVKVEAGSARPGVYNAHGEMAMAGGLLRRPGSRGTPQRSMDHKGPRGSDRPPDGRTPLWTGPPTMCPPHPRWSRPAAIALHSAPAGRVHTPVIPGGPRARITGHHAP